MPLVPLCMFLVRHYFCESTFADASDMLDLGGLTGGRLKPLLKHRLGKNGKCIAFLMASGKDPQVCQHVLPYLQF